MPQSYAEIKLRNGTELNEAASALQKAIRRGQEETAAYWAKEMVESGYHQYLWKRLAVIASEDVGLVDPNALVQIASAWTIWKMTWEQLGKKSGLWPSLHSVVQSTQYLCRAPKNREIDELICYLEELEKTGWRPVVPIYALDAHTERGRELLRLQGINSSHPRYWDGWWYEGTKLVPTVNGSRYHGRLLAYGGDLTATKVPEMAHDAQTDSHECELCGCLGDVRCSICDRGLCLGHVLPCEGLCGRYFCENDRPLLGRCEECVDARFRV